MNEGTYFERRYQTLKILLRARLDATPFKNCEDFQTRHIPHIHVAQGAAKVNYPIGSVKALRLDISI